MSSTTPPAGLCDGCRHARRIVTGRGSLFLLCERSRTDPAYPRYPRLPVLVCAGFEPGEPGEPDEPDEPAEPADRLNDRPTGRP